MFGLLMAIEDDDDRELAESIWRAQEDRIYGFAFSLLGNAEDAEDVQMTVISWIIKNLDKFRGLDETEITALVYTYTKNASFKLYNKKKHEVPTDIEIKNSYFGLERAENTVIEDENVKKLRKAIFDLPEKYLNILILCCFMGYKTGEAAKLLGISAAKAYSQLNYAKTLLKKEYYK